jgi:hypothetical protein
VEAVYVLAFEGLEVLEEFFEELVNVDFAVFGALVNAEKVRNFFICYNFVELLHVGHLLHQVINELDELFLHYHQLNILACPAFIEFVIGDRGAFDDFGIGNILLYDDCGELIKEGFEEVFVVLGEVGVNGTKAVVAAFFMDDKDFFQFVDDPALVLVLVFFERVFHELAQLIQVLDERCVDGRLDEFFENEGFLWVLEGVHFEQGDREVN